MNYLKLLAGAMLLFTACGSDDGPGNITGRSISKRDSNT